MNSVDSYYMSLGVDLACKPNSVPIYKVCRVCCLKGNCRNDAKKV